MNNIIAGVDEVGVGPIAGPVVAAAVILNPTKKIYKLRDSKILSSKQRELVSLHGISSIHRHSFSFVKKFLK